MDKRVSFLPKNSQNFPLNVRGSNETFPPPFPSHVHLIRVSNPTVCTLECAATIPNDDWPDHHPRILANSTGLENKTLLLLFAWRLLLLDRVERSWKEDTRVCCKCRNQVFQNPEILRSVSASGLFHPLLFLFLFWAFLNRRFREKYPAEGK